MTPHFSAASIAAAGKAVVTLHETQFEWSYEPVGSDSGFSYVYADSNLRWYRYRVRTGNPDDVEHAVSALTLDIRESVDSFARRAW